MIRWFSEPAYEGLEHFHMRTGLKRRDESHRETPTFTLTFPRRSKLAESALALGSSQKNEILRSATCAAHWTETFCPVFYTGFVTSIRVPSPTKKSVSNHCIWNRAYLATRSFGIGLWKHACSETAPGTVKIYCSRSDFERFRENHVFCWKTRKTVFFGCFWHFCEKWSFFTM